MAQPLPTSYQQEGVEDVVDLSKFEDIVTGLKSLKLHDEYFETFKKNAVNDDALLCLQKDDVKELIPKIGDRARFMQWFKKYQNDKGTSKVKYQHPQQFELFHPNALVQSMKHTQGMYNAHSSQWVSRLVHTQGTERHHTRSYCESALDGDGDEWLCHDCGVRDRDYRDEVRTGCAIQYKCCKMPYGSSAGCTDQSCYPCCNQRSPNAAGCSQKYSCCAGNTQSTGCTDVSYYSCCNKKKNEDGCAKRYKCCKKPYPQASGCVVCD